MRGRYFLPIWLRITLGLILSINLSFAATVSQSTVEFYYQQGNQYLDQGLYELAIPEYQAAIQSDPKYRPAYRKLGDTYRYLKNYTSAIDNYLKFVNLSTDTADNEGKQLLIDSAKLCEEINDSENALRTLDGLLQYYYPESFDKVETIVRKYRDRYLLSFQTTKNTGPSYRELDMYLQQAMLFKGKLLSKLGRKHKAYDTYSQYFAYSRYRDSIFNDAPGEWYELYSENISKEVPEEWQPCPWVITLSQEKPEYRTVTGDSKIYEDTAGASNIPKVFINSCYIIQAPKGYKIKKIEFTAEIETHNFFAESNDTNVHYAYPFVYDYTPTSAGSASFGPKLWLDPLNPALDINKRQWAKGNLDFKDSVRSTRFWIISSTPGFECYQWKMKAEIISESGDNAIANRDFKSTIPAILVSTHPWAKTKVVIDNKQKIPLNTYPSTGFETYQWDTALATAGWHSYTAEREGLPIKQKQFYWNGTTDCILDIGFDVEWAQRSTNLVLPPNISELKIFRDNNQTFHLLAVAGSDGQSDIYLASSRNLNEWSPLNRLIVNSWENDTHPRLIHDIINGKYYLVWNRNNSMWISTSFDLIDWSSPERLFPFGSNPRIPFMEKYQENSDKVELYLDQWVSESDNGITWSKVGRPNLLRQILSKPISYYHLSDGHFLSSSKEYINKQDKIVFSINDNEDNFREIGSLVFKDKQFGWIIFSQTIELDNGKYGFILDDQNRHRRYFSTSPDLVQWSDPIEIVPIIGVMSNLNKGPSGRFSFLRSNGELWSTEDLK
jgi:tetratricopeptide (TPR) repeat protein